MIFLKKIFVIAVTLLCVVLLPVAIPFAAAKPNNPITVNGEGIFVHDHQGVAHIHYFVFAVSSASGTPQGHFRLVCQHGDQIETVIFSTKITSVDIQSVEGGLEATFIGTANVKMGTSDFTPGWTFSVTAFDFGKNGDQIGVTLIDPQGQMQCTAEATTLTSGHINIKSNI